MAHIPTSPTGAGDNSPAAALARLLDTLSLHAEENDVFLGPNPNTFPGGRVFGGLVAAQAVGAALRTVDAPHRVHSFHSYFLRPGRPGTPIVYAVDRIRDGRSFTTRNVVARQGTEAIFTMTASFHRTDEGGIDYQLPMAPGTPRPEEVADDGGGFPVRTSFFLPFELRDVGPTEAGPDGTYRSTRRVWVRTAAPLPDEPDVHARVLTFLSDMAVVVAARPPLEGGGFAGFVGASLDHAVWFHRLARADEWLFYDLHALTNFNSRGLARGVFHDGAGRLVASVTQEALTRPAGERLPPGLEARPPE